MLHRNLYATGLAVALALGASACREPAAGPVVPRIGQDIVLAPDTRTIAARIPSRSTLETVLRGHELPDEVVSSIIQSAREVFDLRKLRADQPYRLVFSLAGGLREFRYEIDRDSYLRVATGGAEAAPRADIVPFRKERALVAVKGVIDRGHPSLVGALQASGETVELAIALAEVFAGEIDFNNDLQQGDTFQILFEAQLREGRFAGYGPILAAQFQNDGRRLSAVRFEVPGEKPGYYDRQGRSLQRFFLKSPLRFNPTVTSGFSRRRLHPVLGTYRAHLGVDYRAPTGAPVVAVASGVVVSTTYTSASGRMVRLRHASGYETYYLHLSRFAKGMRAGVRVAQGEVIGYVGATGLATAPHLDYRVKRNGQFLNPVRVHRDLPPGEPVPSAHLAAFEASRDAAYARLFDPEPGDVVRTSASPEEGIPEMPSANP